MRRVGVISPVVVLPALLLAQLASGHFGNIPRQQTPPAKTTSAPATRPGRVTVFQPGVSIDWAAPAVRVDGRVVLRAGPLEFLACFGGKEHESIVRLEASAMNVYLALGLIGLTAGHPPTWDEERGAFGSADGDLVDVSFEWGPHERPDQAPANHWLREVEYGRAPLARVWIFAGSQRLSDGTLAADRSGAGVALVSFSDSLLALSHDHSSRNEELWIEAAREAIPPEDTRVRLVLRPARAREHDLRLDFRGAAYVDGRYASAADLVGLLRLGHRLEPEAIRTIVVQGTLRSDVAGLSRVLSAAGVPLETLRFVPSASAGGSATKPGGPRR